MGHPANYYRVEIPRSGMYQRGARKYVKPVCPRCKQPVSYGSQLGPGEAARVRYYLGKAMCEVCRIIFIPVWPGRFQAEGRHL
jgi:hypothetical protein